MPLIIKRIVSQTANLLNFLDENDNTLFSVDKDGNLLSAGTISGTLDAAYLTGIVGTANLGTGTANSSNFLRGDNSWSNTLAFGTIIANNPFTITQTWNNSGVLFAASQIDISDTASNANSYIIRTRKDSIDVFTVEKSGAVFTASNLTLTGNISKTANSSTLDIQGQNSNTANLVQTRFANGTFGQSTGILTSVQISPTVNQSSSAGYTLLKLVATETATGSGNRRIIDAYTGVAGSTNVFYVTSAGVGYLASDLTVGGTISGSGTSLTGVALLNSDNTLTGQNTFAAGTLTASKPLTITQTWNNAGVTFNSLLVNVTDTASASASMLADFQLGGSSVLKVKKTGIVSTGDIEIGPGKQITTTGNSNGMSIMSMNYSTAKTALTLSSGTHSPSSGTAVAVGITPTYNQTGTAGSTDLKIVRTETALGSGTHRFIDCYAGASAATNVFYVTNAGGGYANGVWQFGAHVRLDGIVGIGASYTGGTQLKITNTNAVAIGTASTFTSSTDRVNVSLAATYNQTGTAGSTDLLINRTETAVGSGSHYLIDAQTGGVSKFSVSNAGLVTTASQITCGGYLRVTNIATSAVDTTLNIQDRGFTGANIGVKLGLGTYSASTAVSQTAVAITPTINQTGSATGYTALKIAATETAVLGTNRLIDCYAGASGTTNVAFLSNGTHIESSGTGTFCNLSPTFNQTSTAIGRVLTLTPTVTAVGSGADSACLYIAPTGTNAKNISGIVIQAVTSHTSNLMTVYNSGGGTELKITHTSGTYVTALNSQSDLWGLGTTGLRLKSDKVVSWGATTYYGTNDTGLARSAAGVVKVTDGSTGWGTLQSKTIKAYDETASTGVSQIIVKAGAGQSTTNLSETQNSSGTVLSFTDSSGNILVGSSAASFDFGGTGFQCNNSAGIANVKIVGTTAACFILSKTNATAQAFHMAVDNSGFAFAETSVLERFSLKKGNRGGINQPASTVAGAWHIKNTVTTDPCLIAQAVASQTANLYENRNSGGTVLSAFDASGQLIAASATPASASAAGVAGTVVWDASYIYVCVATDTWKRVAIATW